MTSFESFLDSASSNSHLRVEKDLGGGFVRLRSDEAERRQAAQDIRSTEDIVIELLRNSRDAHAHVLYLAVSTSGSFRSICIIDDGDGIPANHHSTVFEPRVTSKLDTAHEDTWGFHGRGMALYSIKLNTIESRVICSSPTLGTSIFVRSDLSRLPEKADQSSFPTFKIEDSNSISIRGPRNIFRTACEFALEERNSIKIYIGSPAEISAAILENADKDIPFALRAFSGDSTDIPYVYRPAYCSDAQELSKCFASMGIEISVRTAQRVINGEITPPECLIDRIARDGFSHQAKEKCRTSLSKEHNRLSIKLDSEDKKLLKSVILPAVKELEAKYYLTSGNEIDARIERGNLRITIPVYNQDI